LTGLQTPDRAYVVCSTQRSGSTYLCSLLAGTGVAGNPQEFFEAMAETGVPPRPGFFLAGLARSGAGVRDDARPADAPAYSDLRTVDGWRAHLERTYTLGTTDNGVFSTKLMWNQLPEMEWYAAALPELAGLEGVELLEALFGRPSYVWVRRRDKVRQAISLWRALQTGAWRREHPPSEPPPRWAAAPTIERPTSDAGASPPHYSFEAIEHLRRRLDADDRAWAGFFSGSGIHPLELHYEDDVEPQPGAAVIRVLEHVGVEPPAQWEASTSLLRQSDELNDVWRAAYDRDAAAIPTA
jgi:LPS sulfotransferase NodH